jgi:hypothetical protein
VSPRARAVALLREHGFRVGGEQTARTTTLILRVGIFTLRVRLPHSPHAPARALWFGFVSAEGLHETYSMHCQLHITSSVQLACEAVALARTLRQTL